MEDAKQWMIKNKEMLILAGVVGMILSPFLWPFFLAITVQTLGFLIPILIVRTITKKAQKKKQKEKKRIYEELYKESVNCNSRRNVSDQSKTDGQKVQETKSVSKGNKQSSAEPSKDTVKKGQEMSASSCAALMWYQLEGRERLFRLMKRMEKEDRWSFSISREGICTVCEEKGYRRIGALKSFPGREMKVLEKELRKERIRAVKRGKFLWLFWGKEYRQ